MDLKDFIELTLSDIAAGVRAAQERSAALDARINPFRGAEGRSREIVNVEFHVAVSKTSGTGTSGSIGVLAGWIGAKSAGESKEAAEAATTIKFSVPMILPTETDVSKHRKPRGAGAQRVR
jgi:hypothetical protein